MSLIYDNCLLSSNQHSASTQVLLNRVHEVALKIEVRLGTVLASSDTAILNFVRGHWPGSQSITRWDPWVASEVPAHRWLYSSVRSKHEQCRTTLQLDILSGQFLVDGCPVGRLPSEMTSDQLYIRLFGSAIFDVQPSTRPGSYVTKSRFSCNAEKAGGCKEEKYDTAESFFEFSSSDQGLVIVQHVGREELVLVPHASLAGDVPALLQTQHSHWFSRRTNEVLFRPTSFLHPAFFSLNNVDHCQYVLDMNALKLSDRLCNRQMVDCRSGTHSEIFEGWSLDRLELREYVHIWIDSSDGVLRVDLPRMALGFEEYVDESRFLQARSREFSDMVVAANQAGFGTLIGLQHGTLLEALHGGAKRVIVPHKEMGERTSRPGKHQVVKLDLETLKSPRFFTYEVNDDLRILQGPPNQVSWLYLALLHAVTSSPLPDPFTGLTGTESALRIIQCGRAWSCQPLSDEAVGILKLFSSLSPVRAYYPNHLRSMQTTSWPHDLPPSCCLGKFDEATDKILNDSNSLSALFPNKKSAKAPERNTDGQFLNERQHVRNSVYFNNCMKPQHLTQVKRVAYVPSTAPVCSTPDRTALSRSVAYAVNCHELMACPSNSLWQILLHEGNLTGSEIPLADGVAPIRLVTRAGYWTLVAYMTLKGQELAASAVTYLLSLLAFNGIDKDVLAALQAAFIFGDRAPNPDLPLLDTYLTLAEHAFSHSAVTSACRNACDRSKYLEYLGWTIEDSLDSCRFDREYKKHELEVVTEWKATAERQWPSDSFSDHGITSRAAVDCSSLRRNLSNMMFLWYHNKLLHEFTEKIGAFVIAMRQLDVGKITGIVETKALKTEAASANLLAKRSTDVHHRDDTAEVLRHASVPPIALRVLVNSENTSKTDSPEMFEMDSEQLYCKMKDDLIQSWQINQRANADSQRGVKEIDFTELSARLEEDLHLRESMVSKLWEAARNALSPITPLDRALQNAGLWRRITPCLIFPCILPESPTKHQMSYGRLSHAFIDLLYALLEGICQKQRSNRCLVMLQTLGPRSLNFAREIENKGHENWSPRDHPEWLLLEVEGDFLARPLQVTIALSMLHASENSVQQLNMGEGKTSVIVPFLVTALADGYRIPRLTVLRSLYRTNNENLIWKIGGLLNRRVYSFPCRRDYDLPISSIARSYEECKEKRGVVVTCPEYRLSYDLKVLELCFDHHSDATAAVTLRRETRSAVCDILDESDEILHAKYQLVYTMGSQIPADGGQMRWAVSQAVLGIVAECAGRLFEKYGDTHVEYEAKGHLVFPTLRLLTSDSYPTLCDMVIRALFNGECDYLSFSHLRPNSFQAVHKFTTSKEITDKDILCLAAALRSEKDTLELEKQVLVLRGLLAFGILELALSKRYRVNFGVNKKFHRLSAVPFRAKDVAADRVEFGHVDVAIALTNISYYSSGLSDNQLEQAFTHLALLTASDADSIYAAWVSERVGAEVLTRNLKHYENVNLDDMRQRKVLFDFLRRRIPVVNFWLNVIVFPVETKQFPKKLSASAWDLCLNVTSLNDGLKPVASNPTSGFSGTNETRMLLPLTTSQKDQPEVKGTNGLVVGYLLRPENRRYSSFPPGVKSSTILGEVVAVGARVLIDVGALILDRGNKAVATSWLRRADRKEVDACLFFDDNQLSVVDRDGRICAFAISPFQQRLGRCLTYLDEIHTRGTDIRFPSGTHAFVTLGKGLTKDRLVQACMRMRQLGHGHSVSFWAASDVNMQLTKMMVSGGDQLPQSPDVLRWVFRNSVEGVRSNLIHWANQGHLRLRKEAMEIEAGITSAELPDLSRCLEAEILKLQDFYGGPGAMAPLSTVVTRQSHACISALTEQESDPRVTEGVVAWSERIVERCTNFGERVRLFAQVLDEEQERELQKEVEEERQVERPAAASPRTPTLHRDVARLTRGHFDPGCLGKGGIAELRTAFDRTSASAAFLSDGWSRRTVVTSEFVHVLQGYAGNLDEYLRQPAWVVVIKSETGKSWAVLLSPFEANRLIQEFRNGTTTSGRLHMLAPRLRRQQCDLLHVAEMTVPPGGSVTESLSTELNVFAGSVYFNTQTQAEKFCRFLGLLPRPRSEAVEEAFRAGKVTSDGFVLPEFRSEAPLQAAAQCRFDSNPIPMVEAILEARSPLSQGDVTLSHVGPILKRAMKVAEIMELPKKSAGSPRRDEETNATERDREKKRT